MARSEVPKPTLVRGEFCRLVCSCDPWRREGDFSPPFSFNDTGGDFFLPIKNGGRGGFFPSGQE